MFARTKLLLVGIVSCCCCASAEPFDAAPFALPVKEGNDLVWEDPREIHRVVVTLAEAVSDPGEVRLEYWGSRWPQQHLPKDREPGGADVGWMELGNWWNGGWRVADTEAKVTGNTMTFTFKPVNAKEFPSVKEYAAEFRYTLKLRLRSNESLRAIRNIAAFTDSEVQPRNVRLVWRVEQRANPEISVFNGAVRTVDRDGALATRVSLQAVTNRDPNTFDRTLVTVGSTAGKFTFALDDVTKGTLFLPHLGVAVLPENDARDYAAIAAEQQNAGAKTLYDRIDELPEQSWQGAWEGMPRKKSDIYFPLGLDGGRQRFRLNADGTIDLRSNDHYLEARPGKDTPRLKLEGAPVQFRLGRFKRPSSRTLEEGSLPICITTWKTNELEYTETAFVTELEGAKASGGVPAADALAVLMAKVVVMNTSAHAQNVSLPLSYEAQKHTIPLTCGEGGLLRAHDKLRGQAVTDGSPETNKGPLEWEWQIAPGESKTLVLKIPYVLLTTDSERAALTKLDFDKQRTAVAGYWSRRLDESARLITPEATLNDFYRSHAMHLLVNCEGEPSAERRFARVGSFGYGAYGNESCMMVVDLDRRGYYREAQECLDGWLHYQGTVALPGSFASKDGVLYGAGGYEAGGYNQHHGWILWMLAEHYRFTRDESWLRKGAPGIVSACDWIIRETARTKDRQELERGLLPAGSLEDIGDWWTWLSTSCYTWRGLDSAAWALEQVHHPEAKRIRAEADQYHTTLLNNFHKAAERSPVVRLRDGTAVPKIPSYVQRRGRSFGWICETLEGALHLLITRAIDPHSSEAEWILKDYEDNLYLSNQYGYTVPDFDKLWFSRGGMSMQACLLLDVEPYLYRDNVKHALRALFNAEAVSYFPDVRMNTEHAAPYFDDWRGDHFKSSDESNCAGWLRYLFVREEGDELLLGQAVPREWLKPGKTCGIERTATYFGKTSVIFKGSDKEIDAQIEGPTRNSPKTMRLRFREPNGKQLAGVIVNGKEWKDFSGEWVQLPGNIGKATVRAKFAR